MFEPTSADAVRYLDSINRHSAHLCREIESLRSHIQNESSKAEFRFCFWVIVFFSTLIALAGAVAQLR